MASISNPVMASTYSLLPGRNPTGSTTTAGNSVPSIGSSSGQNPVLPPTNLPAGAPPPNPYGGGVIPSFGANTGGGYTPTSLLPGGGAPGSPSTGTGSPLGGISNMSPADAKRLHDELGATYGNGVAAAIMSFLQGGAGFNQTAINNLFASLQPGYERAQENLITQFSTSGNRFGSGAQIGLADLESQQQLNMGQIEAQMYETSVNDYISTLMGITGGTKEHLANSPSLFEQITSPLADLTGGHTLPGFGSGSTSGGSNDQLMALLSTAAIA